MDKQDQDTKDSSQSSEKEEAVQAETTETTETPNQLPDIHDPETLGLPAISSKDWKKLIGCG